MAQKREPGMNQIMHRRLSVLSRIAAALAFVVVLALVFTRVAAAQSDAQEPTRLIIKPLASAVVGTPITASIALTTASGQPSGALGNELLELWVDGALDRRARTDANGLANIRLSSDPTVGSHIVRVIYRGSSDLGPAEAPAQLVLKPASLSVQTVPPLPGVQFALGATQFSAGPDGIAHIDVDVPGTYSLTVLTTDYQKGDTRAKFSRWEDQFVPTRQVQIPGDDSLLVGFDVSHRISWSFVDLDGKPVDPSRVSSISVKATNGDSKVFNKYQPQWLLSSRAVRLTGGLQEGKVQWGVQNVIVDGANTVNQNQQRFYVSPGDRWRLQLLLYTANLAARDALFDFPVGSGFKLEYPDGQERYFPAASRREIAVVALARGHYAASVADAPGLAPAAPIAVTRHQDVELKVVTYFDLAVAGFVLGSVGLGLLFVGRPHLLAWVPTPVRHRNGRTAPVWTTGALLLVLIGVPLLTGSYMLTVRPNTGHKVVVPEINKAGGDKASRGSGAPAKSAPAVIGPLAGKPPSFALPSKQGAEPSGGGKLP